MSTKGAMLPLRQVGAPAKYIHSFFGPWQCVVVMLLLYVVAVMLLFHSWSADACTWAFIQGSFA